MPFTRSTRLKIAIAFTAAYFLIEIIVGYISASIALVADSFHMISDVMSLIVALYAIHLASKTNYGITQTYGWQRAEIIGALVNGVFLLALCFSLVISALQRFIEPEPIINPKLVLIVGSIGLFL